MADRPTYAPSVADLAALPWAEEAPGIHSRAATVEGARWALVRYGPGTERDEWCTDGHRGFVVHGAIAYELANGEHLEAPAHCAFWLPPGLGHRGVNGDAETLLFLVDVPGEGTHGEGTHGEGTHGEGTHGDGTPGDGTPGDHAPGIDAPGGAGR